MQYLRRQAQVARERLIEKKIEDGYYRDIAHPEKDEYTGRIVAIPKIQIVGDQSTKTDSEDEEDGWYSATSTSSILESSDIRSFRAQFHRAIGRIVVYSGGIRFVQNFPKRESWRITFLELAEMRKLEKGTGSKPMSLASAQLEIKCIDGSKVSLGGMKERDEAFNTIIAFSSLQWQSLQVMQTQDRQV